MIAQRSVLAVIAVLALTSCDDPSPQPKATLAIPIDIQAPGIAKETAENAVTAFVEQCSALTSLPPGDIVSATATAQSAQKYQTDRHGWKTTIEVVVKISDNPSLKAVEARAMGHNLFYYLGGGQEPGIEARKRPSQSLCGMTPNEDGKDTFKRVPALSPLP